VSNSNKNKNKITAPSSKDNNNPNTNQFHYQSTKIPVHPHFNTKPNKEYKRGKENYLIQQLLLFHERQKN
jgi:hypothetical protein